MIYTGYIYYNGVKEKFFKNLDGLTGIFLGASFFGLIVLTLLASNELTHLFTHPFGRIEIMFLLVLTTLLFVIVDFLLFKFLYSSLPKVSKSYLLSLIFSDIPITLAFIILTVYAVLLKKENELRNMDAFFGGTIAFQMILSNIIWTFTDDIFLENHSKHPNKQSKKE